MIKWISRFNPWAWTSLGGTASRFINAVRPWVCLATMAISPNFLQAQSVDHGGADWEPVNTVESGHHYNIGRFLVPGGTTLTVQNWLVVDCVSASVNGVIDGSYRGQAGLGGGGGGGGADQDLGGTGGRGFFLGANGKNGGATRGGDGGNGGGGAPGGVGGASGNGSPGAKGADAVGPLWDGTSVNLGALWMLDESGSYLALIGAGGKGGGGGGGVTPSKQTRVVAEVVVAEAEALEVPWYRYGRHWMFK